MSVLALALVCAYALPSAYAGPFSAIAGVAAEGAGDHANLHRVAGPHREKRCHDLATGNSAAAKDKSYRDCLKNKR